VPGRGHDGVGVVERHHLQNQVADGGLHRPEHAFDTPGVFLELDPDDAGPLYRAAAWASRGPASSPSPSTTASLPQ
jgi:hypothetical protein